MPLGSLHVTFLLFYIIRRDTALTQETFETVIVSKTENARRICQNNEIEKGQMPPKRSANIVKYDLSSSPLRLKASSSSLKKSPERFVLENSTPSFLRSDPYMICNPTMSSTTCSLGSPEVAIFQEVDLSLGSIAGRQGHKSHSPSSSTSTSKKKAKNQMEPSRIVELTRARSNSSDPDSLFREERRHSHRRSGSNSFNNSNPPSSSLSDLSMMIDGIAY